MNLSQFLLIVFPDINPIQIDTVLCTIYMETYLLLQTIAVFCKISLYLYCLYYSLLSLVIKYWKIGAFQLFMLRAINYYFILYLVVSVSGTYWQLRYVIVYIRSKKLVSYHTNAWHLLYSIIDSILVASAAAFLLMLLLLMLTLFLLLLLLLSYEIATDLLFFLLCCIIIHSVIISINTADAVGGINIMFLRTY